MTVGHLFVSFGEIPVLIFCPVFDWVVCFDIKLYEVFVYFGNKSLIGSNICMYSLLVQKCVFVLCLVSFDLEKGFKFNYISFV